MHDRPRREEQDRRLPVPIHLVKGAHSFAADESIGVRVARPGLFRAHHLELRLADDQGRAS